MLHHTVHISKYWRVIGDTIFLSAKRASVPEHLAGDPVICLWQELWITSKVTNLLEVKDLGLWNVSLDSTEWITVRVSFHPYVRVVTCRLAVWSWSQTEVMYAHVFTHGGGDLITGVLRRRRWLRVEMRSNLKTLQRRSLELPIFTELYGRAAGSSAEVCRTGSDVTDK